MWEEVKGRGRGSREKKKEEEGEEREIGRKGPERERISRDEERRGLGGEGVGVCGGGGWNEKEPE